MFSGLMAGILWGLDTVVLGIALSSTTFVSTPEAILLAPFVSTFLHDSFSTIWMLVYMGGKKQLKNVIKALRTRSGKYIVIGALLGGPIGMSGYVAAINYIGPSYTAVISALFPALGAFLSYIFLKEKMKWWQICGLLCAILGVVGLGYAPSQQEGHHIIIGFCCALVCVIGWASEAVICAHGMKDPDVSDEQALQIRQCTSALFYGIVIITLLHGWSFSSLVFQSKDCWIIIAAALFGTASYVCYYRAINTIGASKAMALNITYSAWAIVFSTVLLGVLPSFMSVVFAIVIIVGSLTAAGGIKGFRKCGVLLVEEVEET